MKIFVVISRTILFAVLFQECAASESCCKHKLANRRLEEFISDPNELPPEIYEGQPRFIADPTSERPDYWDDEDDGPWEPELLENPEYAWVPRKIPNPDYVPPPTYWKKLSNELKAATPWVTLGILLVATFSSLPLPLETIRSQLSGDGIFCTLKAAIIGLATPLCSCGSLPIASGFVEQGIPLSSVVAFLTASQSSGLDSAVITLGLLGPMATFCRLFGAILLAVVAGTVLQGSGKQKAATKTLSSKIIGKSSKSSFFTTLTNTAADIFPVVTIGLAMSTAAAHFVPSLTMPLNDMKDQEWIRTLMVRSGVLASVLPLQLCEHTTATLAAGIQKAGGSSGLAFAFLLSAPATNLPSLLLLAKNAGSLGRFTVIKAALAISGTALALSYIVDMLGIDMLVEKEAESGSEMASLPKLFVTASPWISVSLAGTGLVNTLQKKMRCVDNCACDSSCNTANNKKQD